MASKLSVDEAAAFFSHHSTDIGEKVFFLVKRSLPENLKWEFLWGLVLTHNPYTLSIQKMYLVCLFIGRVTKNKKCPKSKTLCQFLSNRFETNETCCQHIEVHVLLVSERSDKN